MEDLSLFQQIKVLVFLGFTESHVATHQNVLYEDLFQQEYRRITPIRY